MLNDFIKTEVHVWEVSRREETHVFTFLMLQTVCRPQTSFAHQWCRRDRRSLCEEVPMFQEQGGMKDSFIRTHNGIMSLVNKDTQDFDLIWNIACMRRRFNIFEVFSDIKKSFSDIKKWIFDIRKWFFDIRYLNSWYKKITVIFWC